MILIEQDFLMLFGEDVSRKFIADSRNVRHMFYDLSAQQGPDYGKFFFVCVSVCGHCLGAWAVHSFSGDIAILIY